MRKVVTLFIFALLSWVSFNAVSQTYCSSTWQYAQYGYWYIESVKLGTMYNYNNTYTSTGYSDYTSSYNANLIAATNYTMEVKCAVGIGTSYNFCMRVWADWNKDGSFSATEIIWDRSGVPAVNGSTVSTTIAVPATAVPGTTRLRIELTYDYYGGGTYNTLTTACTDAYNYYGETEDYAVTVQPLSGFNVASTRKVQPQVFGVDSNLFEFAFQNLGADTVYWLDLGYSLDWGTPELVLNYTPKGGTLYPGEEETYVFAKKVYVPTPGDHKLRAWVTNANDSFPDNKRSDDTLYINFCTGMKGTYKIGGTGADFPGINEALTKLAQCGIVGPVVFNVAAGTYNQAIKLQPITGMSATNTVTFIGADKSTTFITNTQQAVIDIDGAKYYRFKNFTINAVNSSNYCVLWFHNDARYNNFDNCVLNAYLSTSSSYNVVLFSGSASSYSSYGANGSYNVVSNCELNNGYVGVSLMGQTYNNPNLDSNVFYRNVFKNQYYYAVYAYYHKRSMFIQNRISGFRYSYAYGMYSYYGQGTVLDGNILNPGRYGYYMYYEGYYGSGDTTYIVNNIISNFMDAQYQQAITLYYYATRCQVLHNTIVVEGNTNSSDYAYCLAVNYYPNSVNIFNNIFYSKSQGYLLRFYYIYYTGRVFCDRNDYLYTTGKGWDFWYYYDYLSGNYLNAYCKNLAQWQAAQGNVGVHDMASMENEDPKFVSATDYHINSAFPPMRFKNDFKLKTDVDGDARCIYETAIGADESSYPVQKPKSKFLSEDTVCVGTPVTFANAASKTALQGYWWYMNGKFKTNDFHFVTTFQNPDIDTITLITENCGGGDTFTKIVVADYPKVKPVTDFVSEMNIVETAFPVQFYDLSTNCPTEWRWSVFPDSVYDPALGGMMPSHSYIPPTHFKSQNPYISFDYPGTYKICLWTKNSVGADSMCKEKYIIVKPSQWMCIAAFPTTTKSLYGILYDDGGPLSNYGNNVNCYIALEPCAGELTFELKNFTSLSGDYLRVYEGTNNQGKKLWNTTDYPNGIYGNFTDATFQKKFTSSTGKLYIEWITNGSGQAAGWEGEWYGTPALFPAPVADFEGPDTICLGVPATFHSTSKGEALSFNWDFDMDKFFDAFDSIASYTYLFFGGSYDITLQVDNCGGTSTKTKKVYVDQPTDPPTADFSADIRKPVAKEDYVKFTDETHGNLFNPLGCVNSWLWKVYPDTMLDDQNNWVKSHTFVGGTSETSQNPIIRFEKTGKYSIKLYATYDLYYTDSIYKQDYIEAIAYCKPTASNLNADIGISRVKLESINNASGIGKAAYTNYSNDHWTYLDILGTYKLTVERNSTFNKMNRAAWIDWNIDGDFDDPGELLGTEIDASTLFWELTFSVPSTATQGSTRMRVATSLGGMPNGSCGNRLFGEVEDYRVVIRPDGTPPEITLIGSDTVYLEQCNCNYKDAGATAYDNIAGSIPVTDKGTNLDCKNSGTYFYNYEAKDPYNNIATKRRVIIVNPDNVAPVIALKGKEFDTLNVFSLYTDPGYNAYDTCSGLDKVDITGSVDTAQLGDYQITYTAYDKKGNTASVSRWVSIRDLDDPKIYLNGYSVMDIDVHTTFNDPGVTITDNYCQNLQPEITGSVNIHKLGSYTLTYSITDCNGNGPASVQRVVNVVDTKAPVIAVKPPYKDGDTITIEVLSVFQMPSVNVSDNYNSLSEMTETYGGTYVSTFGLGNPANQLGDFTFTYKVEDGSGNSSMISFTVRVKDTQRPVITLVGDYVYNICRYDTLDLTTVTATVTDNFDKNLKPTLSGSYFTDYYVNRYIGLYSIVYSAVDNSGNEALKVTRYVNVDECEKSIGMEEGLSRYVRVYPNPTRGEFLVDVQLPQNTELSIVITDMLGHQINALSLHNTVGGTFRIDLSNQAAGVYFVNVTTTESSVIEKITLTK